MGLGTTSWLEALPVVVVAALLMVAPGALAARLAGTSGSTAVCVGPLVTTTTITLAGVLAPLAGVRWSPWVMGVATAVVLGLGALLGRVLRPRPRDRDLDVPLLQLLVPAGIALVAVAATVIPATGSPTAFPQSPDTIYHLGTITWMLGGGDISSLHAGGYASGGLTGFYPAAFHDVAVTLAQLTGASPVVAASSTALVLAALVWPLGLLLLARHVLGAGWWPSIATGLGAAAFSAFPFWLLGYGVLWPNLYGQALLPATLALLVAFVTGPDRLRPALLLAAALPGLGLAHPNAFVAFGLIGALVLLGAALRRAWQDRRDHTRRAVGILACVGVAVVVIGGVWVLATLRSGTVRSSNPPGPEMSLRDGLVDVFFFAPRDLAPLWVTGVLVVVGAFALLVRRRHGWVLWTHLGFAVLYLLDACVDNDRTRLLTWPWYNNSPRLGALLALTGVLLFAAALTALADVLTRVARPRQPGGQAAGVAPRVAPGVVTGVVAGVVAGVVVVATAGLGYTAHKAAIEQFFRLPDDQSFASTAELDGLRELGRQIPAGSVVAANPWKGATYLYLTSDRRLLFPTEKSFVPGDRELLGRHLDDAADDPAVCAAARRQKVDFVVTGGTTQSASAVQARRYRGIDRVPWAPGFTEVASAAGFELYRLDACG